MNNYTNYKGPNNSMTKTQREKPKKVANGAAVEKSGLSKFFAAFLADDIGNIKDYIIYDIVIPSMTNMIEDTINNVVRMLFRGQNAPTSRYSTAGTSYRSNQSYATYYRGGNSAIRSNGPATGGYPVKQVLFATRQEAVDVIAGMDDILQRYESVSVNDYYELSGIDDDDGNFTACDNGWTSLREASVVTVRDGYMIKLPPAKAINN